MSDTPRPEARPYLAASRAFADGRDSPRAFLERRVEAIEARGPVVGAFVETNLEGRAQRARAGHRARNDFNMRVPIWFEDYDPAAGAWRSGAGIIARG